MSLDPPPTDAQLLAMLAERTGARAARLAPAVEGERHPLASPGPSATTVVATPTSTVLRIVLAWSMLHTENGFFRLAGKAYRDGLRRARAEVARVCPGPHPIFARSPIALDVTFVMPDRRRRDMLNHVKLVADALTGLAYTDDSQIVHATIAKAIDVDAPRAIVVVRPHDGALGVGAWPAALTLPHAPSRSLTPND